MSAGNTTSGQEHWSGAGGDWFIVSDDDKVTDFTEHKKDGDLSTTLETL